MEENDQQENDQDIEDVDAMNDIQIGDVLYYHFSSRKAKYAKVLGIDYNILEMQTLGSPDVKEIHLPVSMFCRIFYVQTISGKTEVSEWGKNVTSLEGWMTIDKADVQHKEAVQLINMVCL